MRSVHVPYAHSAVNCIESYTAPAANSSSVPAANYYGHTLDRNWSVVTLPDGRTITRSPVRRDEL